MAVRSNYLMLSRNLAQGLGGIASGDSGGPVFTSDPATGKQVQVGVISFGDQAGMNLSLHFRTDLAQFLNLVKPQNLERIWDCPLLRQSWYLVRQRRYGNRRRRYYWCWPLPQEQCCCYCVGRAELLLTRNVDEPPSCRRKCQTITAVAAVQPSK
jgi:hypothetical protein